MRSLVGPLAPLVLTVGLAGALSACADSGEDAPSASPAADTTLASSSVDTGSAGSAGGGVAVGDGPEQPARGTVEVVRTLPHDSRLFTQGLQVVGDRIYESTGHFGRSEVQHRPLEGEGPVVSVPMAPDEFGEGLAVTDDTVWTLTWKNGVAHNRDPETLEVRSEARYPGEGWGLCYDGERLVMSDGSDRLTFRDPVTFEETGTVPVTAGGAPVPRLNELECADGTVLANVWMTDDVVRIDPASGHVTAVYDASALGQPRTSDQDAVLNGIAALPDSENVLLTGKLWDTVYEVRLVD
ncbi:glutaminyl-peptide cyclotransferase [Dietzia sp. 179-F 9C3 NHS]|uniref:glutaminyl-peptide cyclotransferase n=1 Tax=Dietzia sp. 179-F 9C3 NHS TaxID=3374295 RepID=UPI00387A113E